MIYLYGLLAADAPADQVDISTLTGVTGSVNVVAMKQGHLIYGPASQGEILPKRRFLLAHARVLEAFNEVGTVLPMRFGMSAPSIQRVNAMLDAEANAITDSFKRLDGAIEIGLRVSFPRQAALTAILTEDSALRAERDRLSRHSRQPHFEAAELGRRLAEALGRRRDRAQKAFLAKLVPNCRDHILRAPEEDSQVIHADVLIDRHAQEDFSNMIEAFARACEFAPNAEPEIRLVGPVPTYSFVRLVLSADIIEAA